MSKIIRAELGVEDIISALQSDMDDARNLKISLSAFANKLRTSNDLKGEIYALVANKIESVYISALDTRIKVAEQLIPAINEAVSGMDSYLDVFADLDDSKLDEAIAEYNASKALFDSLNSQLYSLYADDPNGDYAEMSCDISVCGWNMNNLENKVNKLKNLASTDSSLFKKIEIVQFGVLASYQNIVNNIQVSNISIDQNIGI